MISQHYLASTCILKNHSNLPYGIIGIITSLVGFLFGFWQCYIWYPHLKRYKDRRKPSSHPFVVFSLSLANSIACLGSALMSILIILSSTEWWSAIHLSILIQVVSNFGYLSSIGLTFLYLLDVYFQVSKRFWHDNINLITCWISGFLLLVLIQFIQYHDGLLNICTNYVAIRITASIWLGVLTIFFIMDLVMLFLLDKQIKHHVYVISNTYSATQHNLVGRIRIKFFCIVVIFVACWLPTVASCIVYLWDFELLLKTYLWYPEVLLNPLQSIFNFFIFTPQTEEAIHRTYSTSVYQHDTSYASTLNQSLVTPFHPSISAPTSNIDESLFHFCPSKKLLKLHSPGSLISRDSFSSSVVTYGSNWSRDDEQSS